MIKNYLRIAYRTLSLNKVFSFINVFGLSIGMASFLFIIQYVSFERSYEDYNRNAENVFRITLDLYKGSEYVVTDCETYAPVGPLLKTTMPEVVDFVRMFHNDGLQDIEIADRKFLEEGIYYADPSAFEIFSVVMLQGDERTALSQPSQVVLSATMATKLFGSTNVIGESLKIDKNLYTVSGVMKDVPPNTHLKFNALLSHLTLYKLNEWYKDDSWNGNNEYTYLLMAPGTDLKQFNKKLTELSISLKDKIGDERFVAEPMKDIHLHSNKSFEPEVNGNARTVSFLLIIAIFIIVIAWVNYINLSTSRAIERAREVGIRKVMGSQKWQLVLQFLSESVIVNLIAAAFTFMIFQACLPLFRDLTGQPLPVDFFNATFWLQFLLLVLVGSILSGAYPAFVLSSFQPSAVLKGKFRSSSHGQRLRRGLVVFQFAATIILMVCMSTVYMQINYLRNHELGMDVKQTLALRSPQLDAPDSVTDTYLQSFKTELLRHPAIEKVANSESLPGLSLHELSTTSDVRRIGHEKESGSFNYYFFSIDADFISTLDMELLEGRNFKNTGNEDQVIINEEAVARLGFAGAADAIGQKISFRTRWQGEPATIIGVLKNFYQRSPKESHIPMIFRYRERGTYITIKMKGEDIHQTMATIKAEWKEMFANTPFLYYFLDEKYDQQYQADTRFGQVIATFSALALFIASLGLFGLSSFTIVQRTKEIGIRKVLGASVAQIVRLLSQDYARVVMIASLIAIPLAFLAMNRWLSYYENRIQLNVWIFLLPVMVILMIALLTVSFQTIKTALENPTKSLKQE
jgi:putative ABC transport system permease protein